MKTLDLIKKLRGLEREATKGPWGDASVDDKYEHKPQDYVWCWEMPMGYDNPRVGRWAWETDGGCNGYGLTKPDATFITETRNALPQLLDYIEKLQAEIKVHCEEDK